MNTKYSSFVKRTTASWRFVYEIFYLFFLKTSLRRVKKFILEDKKNTNLIESLCLRDLNDTQLLDFPGEVVSEFEAVELHEGQVAMSKVCKCIHSEWVQNKKWKKFCQRIGAVKSRNLKMTKERSGSEERVAKSERNIWIFVVLLFSILFCSMDKNGVIERILAGFNPSAHGLPEDFILTKLTGAKGCGCKVPRDVGFLF